MLDIENAKLALCGLAVAAKISSSYIAQTMPSELDRWVERGGTALCIFILIYVAKSEREERKARQQWHDENEAKRAERQEQIEAKRAERQERIDEASTCAREKLAVALEKLTDKIERR
jgi:hypothetical protein